jgi:perosamine synthetase
VITTDEGGMLLTDSLPLAERARTLRAHGMSVSELARHRAERVVFEEYDRHAGRRRHRTFPADAHM